MDATKLIEEAEREIAHMKADALSAANPYNENTIRLTLLIDLAAALKASEERARKAEDEEEELRELVARYQEASGIDVGGDPGGVTPEILSKFIQSEEARANAAEKQCTELAAANVAANKRIVELEQEQDDLTARLQSAQSAVASLRDERAEAVRTGLSAAAVGFELTKERDMIAKTARETIVTILAERDAARAELARLTTPQPGEPLDMDCGDSSCAFAKTRGSMRTNGGCRCLENLGFCRGQTDSLRRMAAEIVYLRKRLSDITTPRPIAEAPRDGRFVLAFWSESTHPHEFVVRWDVAALWSEWVNSGGQSLDPPSHYLPLPEVKP